MENSFMDGGRWLEESKPAKADRGHEECAGDVCWMRESGEGH